MNIEEKVSSYFENELSPIMKSSIEREFNTHFHDYFKESIHAYLTQAFGMQRIEEIEQSFLFAEQRAEKLHSLLEIVDKDISRIYARVYKMDLAFRKQREAKEKVKK